VDVQLKGYDAPTSNAVLANKSFAFIIAGRSGGTDDPDSTFTLLHHSKGSRNYGSWSDPKFDEMVDQQRRILDFQRRRAYVRDMLTYLIDHCPDVIPANYYVLSAVRPRVKDFAPENFINGRQYESIWLDA
jgi:ABC-type transport system substrate-binding protein